MNIGDKVKMDNKIYKIISESWKVGEVELIKLLGERGGFRTDILTVINDNRFETITTNMIDISEIKISKWFKSTSPKPEKLELYRQLQHKCNKGLLEINPIKIDGNNYLVDGYCSYLVIKEKMDKGQVPIVIVKRREKK